MPAAMARENRCQERCGSPLFWRVVSCLYSSPGDLGKRRFPQLYLAQPQDQIPSTSLPEARGESCRSALADVRGCECRDFAARPDIVLFGPPSDVRQNENIRVRCLIV